MRNIIVSALATSQPGSQMSVVLRMHPVEGSFPAGVSPKDDEFLIGDGTLSSLDFVSGAIVYAYKSAAGAAPLSYASAIASSMLVPVVTSQGWECPECTVINPTSRTTCSVCTCHVTLPSAVLRDVASTFLVLIIMLLLPFKCVGACGSGDIAGMSTATKFPPQLWAWAGAAAGALPGSHLLLSQNSSKSAVGSSVATRVHDALAKLGLDAADEVGWSMTQ